MPISEWLPTVVYATLAFIGFLTLLVIFSNWWDSR